MTASTSETRIWAIVPAAGLSRRMGRAKQTLPFGESTMTAAVVRTLLSGGVEGVIVVSRSELREALRLPDDRRIRVAINDDADSEMIDSIRIGLAALSDWNARDRDGVLVAPADMPALSRAACRACVAAYRADPRRIVIAAYREKRGHPIVFPLSLRDEVERLRDGLRELPRSRPELVHLVPCENEGVVRDVDTPQDYRRTSSD